MLQQANEMSHRKLSSWKATRKIFSARLTEISLPSGLSAYEILHLVLPAKMVVLLSPVFDRAGDIRAKSLRTPVRVATIARPRGNR